MRRLLVLTITLPLLLFISYTRPALTQELYADCTEGMPRSDDFPEADSTCQRKLKLEPWIGTPDVVFTLTGVCVLKVTVCGGRSLCYKSAIRKQEGNWCADYRAVADRVTTRTICCDPKCAKPTPWFDGLSPDPKCKDRQPPKTSVDKDGWIFLQLCGQNVFAYKSPDPDPLLLTAYRYALLDHFKGTVGPTVCCDSFRAAARPGSSCDPRFDLDCDGTLNTTDLTEDDRFPSLDTFAIADGVSVTNTDPYPAWFRPGDKGFMPAAGLCDCKWEIMKAKRTCSPDGKRPHVYEVRWRCPTTGNERFSREEAAATEACGPEAETTEYFRPRSSCPEPRLQFTSTFRWPV
jgi:hypothetical protein